MISFDSILFYLSTLLCLFMLGFIVRTKEKTQIHYAFLSMFLTIFFDICGFYLSSIPYLSKVAVYVNRLGVIFLPVATLFTGLIFARTKIQFSWRYFLFFLFPIFNYALLLTNDIHHLLYIKVSVFPSEVIYGKYFMIYAIGSYLYILIGLFYLLFFSIKNSGFFSKQAMLIIVGSLVPLLANMIETFSYLRPRYFFEITYTFAVFFFWLAIMKYQFLNITPIAMQTVVDQISDSFLIVDEHHAIVDFNKTFVTTFGPICNIKRKDNLFNFLGVIEPQNFYKDDIRDAIEKAIAEKRTVCLAHHVLIKQLGRYFSIEITPIVSKGNFLGTIILFKDITELKRNQEVLTEQERLASLGQMIGGIAHSLKTPIMSLSGGLEALNDLIREYDKSVDADQVTKEDHHQIAREMSEWTVKMSPYLTYMSDLITAVKEQAVHLSESTTDRFTLGELTKRIEILMQHDLKKNSIRLHTDYKVDMNIGVKGEVNNLVQVFNNLIDNAIDSYEEQSGAVDFQITKDNKHILFRIRDYGKGIPPDVQQHLLKEMITTKGKKGTGLGLYMSNATIRGKFGGEMWFESEVGRGTIFYVSIPLQ